MSDDAEVTRRLKCCGATNLRTLWLVNYISINMMSATCYVFVLCQQHNACSLFTVRNRGSQKVGNLHQGHSLTLNTTLLLYHFNQSVTLCDMWPVVRTYGFVSLGDGMRHPKFFVMYGKNFGSRAPYLSSKICFFFLSSVTRYPVWPETGMTFCRFWKGCDMWPTNWLKWYSMAGSY